MTTTTTATNASPTSDPSSPPPSTGCKRSELLWWPERGYGFLDPAGSGFAYGQDYFEACRKLEHECRRTIEHRLAWVRRETDPSLAVDIGIGAGGFCRAARCSGHDVNPQAVEWLETWKQRWFWTEADTMTFWDSLEHIVDPGPILLLCRRLCFISMPIYESAEHCLRSKHFKPGEHVWYFTDRGLVHWMAERGFRLVERNRDEERFGREDIGSYCFSRVLPMP